MKTDILHGDTTSLPVFDWATWPGELSGPQGPGKLYCARMADSDRIVWIHESPRGWQRPVAYKFQGPPMPPLTQTPSPVPAGQCPCGEYHRCTQCGEQTWIEIHGCADGHCTYCHHAG